MFLRVLVLIIRTIPYVAEVAEIILEKNEPKVMKMTVAIDCGIVVNPIAATNQAIGGVIDGIGHAMYGDLTFTRGRPEANNFDRYRSDQNA